MHQLPVFVLTPPQSPVNIPAPKVTVTVPENIATKENINSLLETAIEKQTKIAVKTISDMFKMLFPNGNAPQGIDEARVEEIAQKAADKAVSKRHTQLEATAETLMHRMYNLVNGAIWAAIPKWFYAVAGALLLIAVGLGIGCFHLYKDNESLQKTEWLYRYERLWWKGNQQEDLLRREKTFAVGTQQEQDSIKDLTRQLEKSRHIEETFLYFNPTEK